MSSPEKTEFLKYYPHFVDNFVYNVYNFSENSGKLVEFARMGTHWIVYHC